MISSSYLLVLSIALFSWVQAFVYQVPTSLAYVSDMTQYNGNLYYVYAPEGSLYQIVPSASGSLKHRFATKVKFYNLADPNKTIFYLNNINAVTISPAGNIYLRCDVYWYYMRPGATPDTFINYDQPNYAFAPYTKLVYAAGTYYFGLAATGVYSIDLNSGTAQSMGAATGISYMNAPIASKAGGNLFDYQVGYNIFTFGADQSVNRILAFGNSFTYTLQDNGRVYILKNVADSTPYVYINAKYYWGAPAVVWKSKDTNFNPVTQRFDSIGFDNNLYDSADLVTWVLRGAVTSTTTAFDYDPTGTPVYCDGASMCTGGFFSPTCTTYVGTCMDVSSLYENPSSNLPTSFIVTWSNGDRVRYDSTGVGKVVGQGVSKLSPRKMSGYNAPAGIKGEMASYYELVGSVLYHTAPKMVGYRLVIPLSGSMKKIFTSADGTLYGIDGSDILMKLSTYLQ